MTNHNVSCVVESCGVLYLGGGFTYVGPYTGSFAAINAISGQLDPVFPQVNGYVYAVVSDGAGGWYIGGDFTTVGCASRNNLAHVHAVGTLDPAWDPSANARVLALAVSGGSIYVGGFFASIGGEDRNFIAALDSASGAATAWNPNANSIVESLAVSGNTVYAGGYFTSIGGQNRNYIAALDAASGAARAWNPNADYEVRTLAVSGNTVYVGGQFTYIGGQTRNSIAALDANSGAAKAWDPNPSGLGFTSMYALAVSGNIVYAAGSFTHIGGQGRIYIAALDAVTGAATPWNPKVNHWVFALAVSDDTVYAGGYFTSIGGQDRNYIAALDTANGEATTWSPNANDGVFALTVSNTAVCAGGEFSSIGGQTRNRIAAMDAATGAVTGWNPNANGSIQSLAVSGNTIYAAGGFTSIGGQTRNCIAALDRATGAATAWNPNANPSGEPNRDLNTLAVSGNTVYVGGYFTSIGGQPRNNIAAIDASSGAATAWNPNADSFVTTLAISGSTVYVGGYFTSIGGQPRNNIAAVDASSGAATAWNPNADSYVNALAVSGNTVYTGGIFTSIGGQTRNYIAALDAASGTATDWDTNANDNVYALVAEGSTVYTGGYFTSIGGQPRNGIAALDAVSGAATAWDPSATSGGVHTFAVSDSAVYAGGGFYSVGGQGRKGLAAFSIINSDWISTAGIWNNPANWAPPIVPNNSDCDRYNIRIAGATAQVTLDIDAAVDTLAVEDAATLLITQGSLTIAGPQGVASGANIFVGPGRALIASTATNICGISPIELAGTTAALSSTAGENTITLSAPVNGFGLIDAAMLNQSTIDANVAGETIEIGGPLSAVNGGATRASNGGTLKITRSIVGAGSYVADGGTISLPGSSPISVAGSTLDVLDGGAANLNGSAQMNLASHVRLACGPLVRGCSPPILSVMGNAGMTIGGNLDVMDSGQATIGGTAQVNIASQLRLFCGGILRGCSPPILSVVGNAQMTVGGNAILVGGVSMGPTSTFNLAGNFDNQSNDPMAFHWENGSLTMNGAVPQTFEAAGRDLGPRDPNGFVNNFALGTLRIEPGRTLEIRNDFPNQVPSGCEVLYVNVLSLGTGSNLRLNGCNVYYRRLIRGSGASVVLLGEGALLKAVLPAHANAISP